MLEKKKRVEIRGEEENHFLMDRNEFLDKLLKIGAQHGFGHKALGEAAKGRGTNTGILNMTKSDPLSGYGSA